MAASLLQGIMAPYALAFTSDVNDGETQTGLFLSAGDIQNVNNGGTASGTTINFEGDQNVSGGGTASGTTINGGKQSVSWGGTANSTTINNAGEQIVFEGGTANGTIISGGSQHANGTVSGTTVYNGGRQDVRGTASGTIISSGGSQMLYHDADKVDGTTVNDGGVQIFNDSLATRNVSNNTLNSGASQVFQSGAVASAGSVGGTVDDGITQIIRDGGSAVGVTVNNGGVQNVSNGGVASGTNINGGRQNVSNAGTASGTTINNGTQHISNGGIANDTTISGGTQIVSNGGVANITTVLSGGTQTVSSGGSAISSIINSGGTLNVASSGIVTSAILQGGNITGNMTYGAGQVLRGEGGTINGNVTFNGGTFIPVLNPASADNPVNVTGTVTGMAGGTIAPVWYQGQAGTGTLTYTVLSATSLDATFGTETELVKAKYTQEISGNELLLHVTEQSAGFSTKYADYLIPNALGLGVVLDAVDASGQLPTLMAALGNLPADGEIVGAALRQLVPESFSTANALNHSIIRAFMAQSPTMAGGTLRVGEDAKPLTASRTSGIPSGSPMTAEFKQNTWQFFGSPFGFTATQQSTDDFSGYDMTAAGVNLGIMRSFDNYWLGASLGYSSQYLKMKDIEAKIDSDQLMLSVFGGVRYNDFFAEAALGYAHTWNDSSRSVAIGTGPTAYYDELTADYGQDSFLASLTLGYIFEFDNNFRIIPSIGVDYVHTHSNAFEESGGDGALDTDANSFHSVQIPVSITLEKSFMVNEAIITPSLTASWRPELGDVYATTNSHFVNAPSAGSFETRSMENDRHTFAFGAGLDMQFSEDFGIDVNYELNTRSKYTSHSVDVNFKWEF